MEGDSREDPSSPLGSPSAAGWGFWGPWGPPFILPPPSGAAAEVPEPEPLGQGHTQHGEFPPLRHTRSSDSGGLQRPLPSVPSGEAPGTPLTLHRPCRVAMGPRTGSLSLPESFRSWKVLESCHRGRHSLAFLWPKFPGYAVGDRCVPLGPLSAGTWGSPPGVGEACPTPTPHVIAPQGRLVLSNKMARTIGFFYTLFLHCLVFLVSSQAGGQGCLHHASRTAKGSPAPWANYPGHTVCSRPLLSSSRGRRAHPSGPLAGAAARPLWGSGLADFPHGPALEGVGEGMTTVGARGRGEGRYD